jgi:hypothetical protein
MLADALDQAPHGRGNLWLSVLTLTQRDLRDQRRCAVAIQLLRHQAGMPEFTASVPAAGRALPVPAPKQSINQQIDAVGRVAIL